jgi:hypothetical protein
MFQLPHGEECPSTCTLQVPYLTLPNLQVPESNLITPGIPVITDGKGMSVLSVITDHQSLLTTSRLYSSVYLYNFWLMTCYSPPRGPITCNFLPPSIHPSIHPFHTSYGVLHTSYSVLHTLYSIILHTSHLSLLPLISNCD